MKIEVKARKKHGCDTCSLAINIGDIYELTQLRLPRYAEDGETQIGVCYLKFKSCPSCVDQAKKEAAEWEAFTKTKEYKYQESMWEHRYP